METQLKAIKSHLNSGKSITSLEAMKLYGCSRLASRIFDLNYEGFRIESKFIKVKKSNGKYVSVKQYKKQSKSK